jgi:hypothetical protein
MSLSIDARSFRDLLSDPAAAESLSAVTGCPQVVVEISDRSDGLKLAGLDAAALPAVGPACPRPRARYGPGSGRAVGERAADHAVPPGPA